MNLVGLSWGFNNEVLVTYLAVRANDLRPFINKSFNSTLCIFIVKIIENFHSFNSNNIIYIVIYGCVYIYLFIYTSAPHLHLTLFLIT